MIIIVSLAAVIYGIYGMGLFIASLGFPIIVDLGWFIQILTTLSTGLIGVGIVMIGVYITTALIKQGEIFGNFLFK